MCVLLVIFKTALFLRIFSLIMLLVCSFMFIIFTTAIPDSSSMKGPSIITIFCILGPISTAVTGKNGINLLRELKQDSHEPIMPSNSKILFIPITKSYIVMNFRYQSEDFNSISMYFYDHWYYKQYTDILSISYLNSLSIRRKFWLPFSTVLSVCFSVKHMVSMF